MTATDDLTVRALIPHLHHRLHDTRRELDAMTNLARNLAQALDAEVDTRWGRGHTDFAATAAVLLEARRRGLLR